MMRADADFRWRTRCRRSTPSCGWCCSTSPCQVRRRGDDRALRARDPAASIVLTSGDPVDDVFAASDLSRPKAFLEKPFSMCCAPCVGRRGNRCCDRSPRLMKRAERRTASERRLEQPRSCVGEGRETVTCAQDHRLGGPALHVTVGDTTSFKAAMRAVRLLS
jgi:hypothetical protein